ncbi:MarR family winged helix-turn-helix transcriptional regulator [uncultured Clostridium sp.]|uniref:MarR family winged helix-turn-helix transcriptional regulator n=1 Tax=uncultured Clostridium sp. TaxID=59620 RepID=UPI0025ED80B5|nr:MarR family transcriptional regulator [uncultured Clostridium sp.]
MKKEEIRLSLLLKMVNNMFERKLNNRAALMDLTNAQCRILGYLDRNRNREIYLNDIEKRFCLKRPTVTGLIKRLEEKQFIHVETKADDRRYKKIILTDKSEEIIEFMKENLENAERALYKDITEEEKNELYRILLIMFNSMKDEQ